MRYPSLNNIMGPAEFEALREVQNPVQLVLNQINGTLAYPQSVPEGMHPYRVPFYYVEAAVELTFQQAQSLLRICRESGWKHVQIAYTPAHVEVRLCNDENQNFWPSWYQNERGQRREVA